jgi:hypothetical protein
MTSLFDTPSILRSGEVSVQPSAMEIRLDKGANLSISGDCQLVERPRPEIFGVTPPQVVQNATLPGSIAIFGEVGARIAVLQR